METCGNTMENSRKWLGNWGNSIEEITMTITREAERARFYNFITCTKIVKITEFYTGENKYIYDN